MCDCVNTVIYIIPFPQWILYLPIILVQVIWGGGCPKSGSQNDGYWISWHRLTQVLCSLIRECKLFGLLWDFTTWMCTWTELIHTTCSGLAKPRFLVKLCIFELRHRSVPSNMLLHFQNMFWKRQAVSNPGGVWWPFEYRLKCKSKKILNMMY